MENKNTHWYGKMLCNDCLYVWQSRKDTPPAKCPKCRSGGIEAIMEEGFQFPFTFAQSIFILFSICYITLVVWCSVLGIIYWTTPENHLKDIKELKEQLYPLSIVLIFSSIPVLLVAIWKFVPLVIVGMRKLKTAIVNGYRWYKNQFNIPG